MRVLPALTASAAPAEKTVTAAGDFGGSTGTIGTNSTATNRKAWQGEAWGYYDTWGMSHYGAQFIGSCYSRCRLVLGYRGPDGTVAPVFDGQNEIDENCTVPEKLINQALAVLGAFGDALGGTNSILETIGKNLFISGELHLHATDVHTESGTFVTRRWEVLSTDEIKRKPSVKRDQNGIAIEPEFTRMWPGSGRAERDIPAEEMVLRIYRRHPRFSWMADSSMRPLLDIMELLVLLVRQIRASTISRIAGAGILFMPSEVSFADDDTAPEGSEESETFQQKLIRIMSEPIRDRSAASGVVPFVVELEPDLIQHVTHLTFDSHQDELALQKIDALQLLFAQGADLPVEQLQGHMSTTFANAVQIDESTYKAHIEPGLELVCSFLTAGYLWPSLGAERIPSDGFDDPLSSVLPTDDLAQLLLLPDPSALVTHANREQNAIEALKMVPPLIAGASGRRALGFTEADEPDDDEINTWVRIRQQINTRETVRAEEGANVSLIETPLNPAVLDQPDQPVTATPPPAPPAAKNGTAPPAPAKK